MHFMQLLCLHFFLLHFLVPIFAHPGEEEKEALEALSRRALVRSHRRALDTCNVHLRKRGIEKKIAARHLARVQKLHAERELEKLKLSKRSNKVDAASVLKTDHNKTEKYPKVSISTPLGTFFDNKSCVLVPEVTEGPYWVQGELLRNDIRQGQKGVNLYMDLRIIDISSCKPMSYVYLDLWHANSTGVYSGVSATGNGASADDTSNLNSTFLRGIAATDEDGIVEMVTVVPGHYTGRTNHIHVMAHHHGIVARNHTYIKSKISHVGQMFFDQSLLKAVEATKPYSKNNQDQTKNKQDTIFSSEADGYDPVLNYVYLGSDVEDGLFAWTTIGINASATYDPSPAAYWTSDGGVESENSGEFGPGANGTTGSMPTGSAPTGTPPTGSAKSSTSAS